VLARSDRADPAGGLRHLDRGAGRYYLAGDRVFHLDQHSRSQRCGRRDLRMVLTGRDRSSASSRVSRMVDGVLGAQASTALRRASPRPTGCPTSAAASCCRSRFASPGRHCAAGSGMTTCPSLPCTAAPAFADLLAGGEVMRRWESRHRQRRIHQAASTSWLRRCGRGDAARASVPFVACNEVYESTSEVARASDRPLCRAAAGDASKSGRRQRMAQWIRRRRLCRLKPDISLSVASHLRHTATVDGRFRRSEHAGWSRPARVERGILAATLYLMHATIARSPRCITRDAPAKASWSIAADWISALTMVEIPTSYYLATGEEGGEGGRPPYKARTGMSSSPLPAAQWRPG